MLLYASELREEETPLVRAERDETLCGRDGGEGRARGGGERGRGGAAPAAYRDDDGEHGAGGDGTGQIQGAGTA
jgi:hypothetical protein